MPAPTPARSQDAVCVLLVEDDPVMAALITELLADHPVEVARAGPLREALEHLDAFDIDCAVIDLGLPDAHGSESVAAIHRAFPSVPMLVLSGVDGHELARVSVEHGAQAGLSKDDIDGPLLWRGISAAMTHHRGDERQVQDERLAALLQIAAVHMPLHDRLSQALAAARTALDADVAVLSSVIGDRPLVTHAAGDVDVMPGDAVPVLAPGGCLSAAVVIDGEVAGSVDVGSSHPTVRRWSRHDREYLRLLANVVSGWLTDRHHVEQLEDARARFQLAFDRAPIGMALVDLDGRFLEINDAFVAQAGHAVAALTAGGLADVIHPDDAEDTQRFVADVHDPRTPDHAVAERRFLRADRTEWWGSVHASLLRNESGEPQYFIAQVIDVTERRQAHSELTHLALHDALTGLPNRTLLEDRIDQELAGAHRTGATTALLFLDLDGFKAVNDRLGHAAGDELLRVVGRRIGEVIRPRDTVARLGGDEFVVLCGGIDDESHVDVIVDRIATAVEDPVRVDGTDVRVGVSIGVTMAAARVRTTAADLLREADTAMYRAKARGRATQAS
ncbi:diguanylate cyclase domain-containing protein [Euzebya sp.]|uniref:diguanylate cyclase domain-containing protein n=1 Tax=Euzebya sp. TaxID=1971409 RepID=UPI003511C3AA